MRIINENRFTNIKDKLLQGDISSKSMNAYLIIQKSDKIQISTHIKQFLYYNNK